MKLAEALPDAAVIAAQVAEALSEDVGQGDLTAKLLPADQRAKASVVCRDSAVLSGQAWFDEVFRQTDASTLVQWQLADGERMQPGQVVCEIRGSARSLLTAERTALNFVQTLSGTATVAARYVDAVADTKVRILDTRKTLPGLRVAQKYAVLCGGASNHRIGLFDAILIKENHIAAAGSVAAALHAASAQEGVEIEIEVETLDQLQQALAAGARRVLLDNFSNAQLRQAVALNQGQARLEASGGVGLETIGEMAQTGVDDISVGAITKDLRATDFSMLFDMD